MSASDWKSTGHGSYRELRKGVVQVDYRPFGTSGPRKRITMACTVAEAKSFLLRQAAERTRAGRIETALDWDEALDLYRSRLESAGTVERYREAVFGVLSNLRELFPELEKIQIIHIQTWIDRTAAEKKRSGSPGYASTVNRWRAMASGFFSYLHRMRKIESNPVAATFPLTQRKTPKRDLTPKEYAALWKVSEPEVRDMLDFSLLTGCRSGEMFGLKHSDIKRGVWICRDRKGKDFMKAELAPEILAIIARQPKSDEDDLVFHRTVGRTGTETRGHGFKYMEPLAKDYWREVLLHRSRLARIDPVKPHDLRHAAATWARSAGCSPWNVQELLGHSTVNTTEIYAASKSSGAKVVTLAILETRNKALKSIA